MRLPIQSRSVTSPGELTHLLRDLKQWIGEGRLRQVVRADAPFATANITEVAEEGPWPDYLEAYFEDREHRQFKLTVETYHGLGGSWERL